MANDTFKDIEKLEADLWEAGVPPFTGPVLT
jgi:hypothetical protein